MSTVVRHETCCSSEEGFIHKILFGFRSGRRISWVSIKQILCGFSARVANIQSFVPTTSDSCTLWSQVAPAASPGGGHSDSDDDEKELKRGEAGEKRGKKDKDTKEGREKAGRGGKKGASRGSAGRAGGVDREAPREGRGDKAGGDKGGDQGEGEKKRKKRKGTSFRG